MSHGEAVATYQLGPALVRWTDARHGDFGLAACQRTSHDIADLPPTDSWARLTQVHGTDVVVARNVLNAGIEGDALVTTTPCLPLAIQTADCAPLALLSIGSDSDASLHNIDVIAAVHGGWRSLASGIVENTVHVMRTFGAENIIGAVGPFIHAECYAFDPLELAALARDFGDEVIAQTSENHLALDMQVLLQVACRRAGVELRHVDERCTGCNSELYSHRKRQSAERQVMLVELRSF